MTLRKLSICGLVAVLAGHCFAQKLTIDEAIRLAKQNNGTFKSAVQDLVAARERRTQAEAAFLPTLTPSAQYSNVLDRLNGVTTLDTNGTTTQAALVWQPLDAGQRAALLRSAREGVSGQTAQTQQTLRVLIFNVVSQFLDTLRSQALEKVAVAQLDRTNKVLDQTKTRVQVGDAAKREVLQAEADALNAQVNSINAKNSTNTNAANLKAIIGLQKDYANPDLETVTFSAESDLPTTIETAVTMGLKSRPDLIARRKNVESQADSARVSAINAGLTWAVDLSYTQQFSTNTGSERNATALVSYPLFDGGKSRSIANEQRANLEGSRALLSQAEKDARSEIEAAFRTYQQDQESLKASALALQAAQLNYEAADGSQKEGAASLLDVITAQVSLVTAESNNIQATYDLLIAQYKLRLVTGLVMPGELL